MIKTVFFSSVVSEHHVKLSLAVPRQNQDQTNYLISSSCFLFYSRTDKSFNKSPCWASQSYDSVWITHIINIIKPYIANEEKTESLILEFNSDIN